MKIIGIGRNYIEHAKELNNEVPKEPVLFFMPDTALLRKNQPLYYPNFTKELHYETEIVVKINRVGKNIAPHFANRYYEEIGIGIDFTARDLQRKCKEKGLPWSIAKGFDGSAAISEFVSKEKFQNVNEIDFSLKINDELKQSCNTKNMIFSIDELISYISKFFMLKIGDLIFTGTPSGVGEVKIGDKLEAFIGQDKMMNFEIK